MAGGEVKAGLAVCMKSTQAGLDSTHFCESAAVMAAGASSQILKAVYVRYRDHVFFKNIQAPAAEAIIREVLGWVRQENDEVMLIECDRPLMQGCSGFNGVVILKNCIVALLPLGFEHNLNYQFGLVENRVCASSQRSEKLNSEKIHAGVSKH